MAARLRHVVLLAFKPTVSPQDVQQIEEMFVQLEHQISEVDALEWGLNVSPENLAQGFTHCFLLTFETAPDRDTYLTHPGHLAFTKKLEPHLENVCVIDYWS